MQHDVYGAAVMAVDPRVLRPAADHPRRRLTLFDQLERSASAPSSSTTSPMPASGSSAAGRACTLFGRDVLGCVRPAARNGTPAAARRPEQYWSNQAAVIRECICRESVESEWASFVATFGGECSMPACC